MSQAAAHITPRPETRSAPTARAYPGGAHRVYALALARSRGKPPPGLVDWIADTGFDTVLLSLPTRRGSADISVLPPFIEAAAHTGLHVQIDLRLDIAGETSAAVARLPNCYRSLPYRAADPRQLPAARGMCIATLESAAAEAEFIAYWTDRLAHLNRNGIASHRCIPRAAIPARIWRELIVAAPDARFTAWTPGAPAEVIDRLPEGCFDATYNSLAWWDFGAGWLREEAARLRRIAPVANTLALSSEPGSAVTARQAALRLLDVAASNGNGLLLPMGFEFGLPSPADCPAFGVDDWERLRGYALLDLTASVRQANHRLAARAIAAATPEVLSSDKAPVAVLFEPPAQLTLVNRSLIHTARIDPAAILPALDGSLSGFTDIQTPLPLAAGAVALGPGEVRVFKGASATPITVAVPGQYRLTAAASASRVAIEAVSPCIDGGRFAVKRIVGQRVMVTADLFADGHGELAAAVQWRAGDAADWHEAPMRLAANDRWSGEFPLERVGPYVFRVVAWPDRFATWRTELLKKRDAGLDVTLEMEEGRILVGSIAETAVDLDLLSPETAALIARADTRPGQAVSEVMTVVADRRAAEFAAWYELFPRNQSGDPARHGTFRDVIRQLPAIRDMGFDVVYFPPIHPIGRTNRKGHDNKVITGAAPADDEPGSPYAIGSAEGGHDAIHPDLGGIEDFRAMRDAAAAHGLEIALDFAIQCSPDHPWLREHPEWFDWRPDGGLRYAENPPKKYEDIVNVDFYRSGAIPGLWRALRDVVAYWADEGVRLFRVDNPHTKPFAFWEWLIADIRASHPGTLFLSEAFTRPKVMYRLAKLGFSQSYTYFTWRNEKPEIETYLSELTEADGAREFFRPHFFVNTPDINPVFLQHSGRAGFLIRAGLAATLSGLWGMLQGFELCEAAPLPGREEYAHSDKYEIRVRPARAPGDIVDEITLLNAIRRANPALRSHRGLAFHTAWNDRVLWYRKENVDRSNVVLIAVSLDPFAPQSASVEVPLWEWGLPDHASLIVEDLVRGGEEVWAGKYRTIGLDPRTLPFGIWRARPLEER